MARTQVEFDGERILINGIDRTADFNEAFDKVIQTGDSITTDGEEYSGTSSYQPVGPDLNLAAAAGNTVDNPKFLAAVMGNVIGASLTKQGAYLAGVIAALSVTGTKATKYQAAALIGILMDGVSDADGIVTAVIDGDDPSSATRANAAFAARMNNNHAGSGVDYGLDLVDNPTRLSGAFSGTAKTLPIAKADLRLSSSVCVFSKAGVPTDGGSGDGAGFAGPGSICVDRTNKNAYIQTGTLSTMAWKLVTRAA